MLESARSRASVPRLPFERLGVPDGGAGIIRRAETALRDGVGDQLRETRLEHGALSAVDQLSLQRVDLHPHHVVAPRREAGGGDAADVAKAEDGDSHACVLSSGASSASSADGSVHTTGWR